MDQGNPMEATAGAGKDENLAYQFARKLAQAEQVVNDPNGKTSRRKNRSFQGYNKDDIEGFLKAPTQNEKNLRNASIFIYQTNNRYRNLLSYYASIPKWAYIVVPAKYKPEKAKPEAYMRQYVKVCHILESMGIQNLARSVVTVGLREGAFYGVIWGGNGDHFILQQLDADNCAITGVGDSNVFRFAYNMASITNEADLDTYFPPQFRDMYNEYQRTGVQYQNVPTDIAVCFKADPTIVTYSLPVFSGILPMLHQIQNTEALAEVANEMDNYKLLHGRLPIDKETGAPLIDFPTAMEYYKHIAANVGERIGVAISPFEVKDFAFDQSATSAQIDSVARANENFFAAAGTSALLHGATNNTAGVTKLSTKVDESLAFGWVAQFENIVNLFLRQMAGTVKFKIRFLDISCFNEEEKISEYRNAMNYGVGKLEYLAAIGIKQLDILGEHMVETDILDIDNLFTPMKTASTQSSESEAGRPETQDEGDLSPGGEDTRANDSNANR